MAYKHGVYVGEVATSITAPIEGTAGLQVILGTAPVHLAKDPYACSNKPILCYSFAEAAEQMGYLDDFHKYTLCQSVDASFRVFNIAPIILINVLDPTKHKKTLAARTLTVIKKQAVLQEDGVLLDQLVVKSEDGQTALAKDTDYVATFDDDGFVTITLITSGEISAIQVSGVAIDPTAVEAADVIGGIQISTGEETGMEVIRQIYPKLGMTAGLLLAPGWSQDANVAAALQAKSEAINGVFSCECFLDIPCGTDGAKTYTDVKEAKESLGASSNHAFALWPKGAVGSKHYYLSALAAACTAYTDANNEDVPATSPSNKNIRITATVLEDGTVVDLDQEQANTINSFGVATALNMNGFKLWGNNTAAYPSTTDPKDRWLACRRFFSWWGNTFILTYFQKVDSPGNYRLIESIVDSENIRGNSFVARGFCAAARIEFLESENPITDILGGKMQFHIYLAPYTPAEILQTLLEFDVNALEAALTGGE